MSIRWEWSSIDSVGPIKHAEPALPVIQRYNLLLAPEYGSPDRDVYQFEDGTTMSVEGGLVDSVMCQSNFFYKGTNLIGLSINDVREILGKETKLDDDFEDHTCLEYDDYDLMIWIDKEVGKIDSVSCF
jgi:hypothetical protein